MLRFVKQLFWLAMLVFSASSAWAFSLEGPAGNGDDDYQIPDIGYNLSGDIENAPKKIGQEYRRNTPVMYYSMDENFLEFFGADGINAVDQAFAVFNNLTNVSAYSSSLFEFPLNSQNINATASALSLIDLKSATLGTMVEQLGLFQPARSVWVLRDRDPGPTCPQTATYLIAKRNVGIVPTPLNELQYSSYVNDVLYTYFIFENCGTPGPPFADAIEEPADPLATPYTAVADWLSQWYIGIKRGGYYTGLTRDDMAGLRYLLRTNNYNLESSGPGTVQFVTNSQPAILTTLDLGLFSARALTNDAGALVALYPGLVITSTSNKFEIVTTTNITVTLVSSPYDPYGTPPSHPKYSTNKTQSVVTFYQHTFGNLITNQFSKRGFVGTVTIALSNSPYAPFGTPPTVMTNITTRFITNGVFGDFYILPTNLCAVGVISNLLTQVITNITQPTITADTNNTVTFTPGTVTYFTNHTLLYFPVTCPEDTVAERQGIERIRFLRRDFDSLTGRSFQPITNDYTLISRTNSMLVPQRIRRVITEPDFLFTASETPNGGLLGARSINFHQANTNSVTLSAGPGTIETPTLITFNNDSPLYANTFILSTNFYENQQITAWIWGSFDGSTNPPIVYPNGTSITSLENLLLAPFITTASLPTGIIGTPYTAQFQGTGGQVPYVWSLAPGSGGLPAGLSLSADGEISGTPTGPDAIYDFIIRITDNAGAFKDVPFTITIQ